MTPALRSRSRTAAMALVGWLDFLDDVADLALARPGRRPVDVEELRDDAAAAEQLPHEWLGVTKRRAVRVVVGLGQDGYRGSLGRGQAGDRLGVALVYSVAEQLGGLVSHDGEPRGERDRGVVRYAGERSGAGCRVGCQGIDHAPAGGIGAVQAGDLQALGAGGSDSGVESCRGYRALDVVADGDRRLGVAQGLGLKLAGGVGAELVEEPDARSLADRVAHGFPMGRTGPGRSGSTAGSVMACWPVASVTSAVKPGSEGRSRPRSG